MVTKADIKPFVGVFLAATLAVIVGTVLYKKFIAGKLATTKPTTQTTQSADDKAEE